MDHLANDTEKDVKKRRFRIGIVCIVIGLAGMLMTAINDANQQPQPTEPTTSAVSEPTEAAS